MAYQKKTVTKTVVEDNNIVESKNNDTDQSVQEDTVYKYEKDETILCKSITNGMLLITGDKSGILYRWADYGDFEDVEYQDLIYMIRSHRSSIYKPRFIIQDKRFLSQHPELNELYNSLYSTKDLKDILSLPILQMKSAIKELPDGAFDSIKGVAASMISSGQYDSVKKIKALDEIFGTNLLLTLVQN